MSSVEEINSQRAHRTRMKPKPSALKKYLKILVGAAVAWKAYDYFTSTKIISIPNNIFASDDKSRFEELFSSPQKKIVWFGADCPLSRNKKKIIDITIQKQELGDHYKHQPFLQNSLAIDPNDQVGHYLVQNCSSNICIILPSSHQIIPTDEKHLLQDMFTYMNS